MDDMNELFDVQIDSNKRRKGVFGWFSSKTSASAKTFALSIAAFIALSAPVALFAIRNGEPSEDANNASEIASLVTSTTVSETSSTSLTTIGGKQSKSGNLPGLVLPARGSAPAGTTSTTTVGELTPTSTSSIAPPAPPIVLAPVITITPGSVSRTVSFSSTTSVVKTYGDSLFAISLASPSIGSGEVRYSSSNMSVCAINASSGEVALIGAGICEVSATVATSGIYASASTTENVFVNVNKAPLMITASSASIAYAPWRYVVTASYLGFVNGENPDVLSTLPTCLVVQPSDFEISSNDRRTYATSCNGAAALNYDISYIGGVLTVSSWK